MASDPPRSADFSRRALLGSQRRAGDSVWGVGLRRAGLNPRLSGRGYLARHMSLLLTLLHWLFGRRFRAADRWRLRRADFAAYMMAEMMNGAVLWDDPEDRAWLLDNLRLIERAAFRWAPRRCRGLREAMGYTLSPEAVYVRLGEARCVLLGPQTKPIHGKGRKIRKGRKFLHRKKLMAWLAKRRRFAEHPRRRAARGPPYRNGDASIASHMPNRPRAIAVRAQACALWICPDSGAILRPLTKHVLRGAAGLRLCFSNGSSPGGTAPPSARSTTLAAAAA